MNFDHGCRKNYQLRQGTTVTVSAIPQGEVSPVRLLRELEKLVESYPESCVFRGFNGGGVAKSPSKTQPLSKRSSANSIIVAMVQWSTWKLPKRVSQAVWYSVRPQWRSIRRGQRGSCTRIMGLAWRLILVVIPKILHGKRPRVHFVRHSSYHG